MKRRHARGRPENSLLPETIGKSKQLFQFIINSSAITIRYVSRWPGMLAPVNSLTKGEGNVEHEGAASAVDSLSRRYPRRPWVGVGVVVWRDNQLLLVRRGRPPAMGSWSLPGGAQEVGETIYQAAMREVAEETGLAVTPTGMITAVDAISSDEEGGVEYHYTIVEVSAESPGGDVVCGDDAADFHWVRPEDLSDFTDQGELIRVVLLAADQRRSIR